tara:strand:- start:2750 stop:3637 length:888 start_codon:yes stop_codon:yes gene_type:complete
LLDIDDWDVGFAKDWPAGSRARLRRVAYLARRAINPRLINSEVGTRVLEPAHRFFRQRLVSNRWLQRRFGGALLYHVRDPSQLDPARADRERARARLDLSGERSWVGFVGTLRPHKGVQDLIEALAACGPEGPGLALLGGEDARNDFACELLTLARARLGPSRLRSCEAFPFARLPEQLSALDLVALPSRDVPAAHGQIPAKLFDAMAMAKPIVVTDVNDMAWVLGAGGRVVAPQDPQALRGAIQDLLSAPARARALGAAGRERLIEHFSYRAGRQVLHAAVSAAWEGAQDRVPR